jgi:hypothetical protein
MSKAMSVRLLPEGTHFGTVIATDFSKGLNTICRKVF